MYKICSQFLIVLSHFWLYPLNCLHNVVFFGCKPDIWLNNRLLYGVPESKCQMSHSYLCLDEALLCKK